MYTVKGPKTINKKNHHKNMPPKEERDVLGNALGSFGNENIRMHHIRYFEKKILEHKENAKSSITLTPNYYAWLCIITEHIFWIIRKFCFQQELHENNLTLYYNEIITKFCDTCRELGIYSEPEIKVLYEKLVKVLEIRHAIIHKGFPNLLPVMFRGERNKPALTEKGEQQKFSELTTRETISWFSDPRNFQDIKTDLEALISAIMTKAPKISFGFSNNDQSLKYKK